ncbi:3alpha(or 20beta)-hydroxysteroid dehydrogenase [Paraglaciecola agarilytica NO2]|uniref:3alpha(Or 20beta)-hydroxysteroid dehydrogenase n=2 Tax=Paraglaciecola chathamensis TaxID=368405 RepID=A0ABQ0I357_9ALTE|nr:3alpha(or 20beta)-hydroxysteroid dehydrogenase [Paraglaciecola agarilytica NO2]
MGRLDGKIAIITGAASGMGASTAKLFVQEGAKVVVTTGSKIEQGKELARKLGQNAQFMQLDVRQEEDWIRVVKETEKIFGNVNILMNNAGVGTLSPIEAMSLEDFNMNVDVNQVGVFLGMKQVLPSMKKTGNGSIINISSIDGMRGSKGGVAYSASKYAVKGMTKVAAKEFAEYGIRVNAIYPGAILTPLLENEKSLDLNWLKTLIPLDRIGDPIEIAHQALYLASDDSSYSTGADFVVDGGQIL